MIILSFPSVTAIALGTAQPSASGGGACVVSTGVCQSIFWKDAGRTQLYHMLSSEPATWTAPVTCMEAAFHHCSTRKNGQPNWLGLGDPLSCSDLRCILVDGTYGTKTVAVPQRGSFHRSHGAAECFDGTGFQRSQTDREGRGYIVRSRKIPDSCEPADASSNRGDMRRRAPWHT